MSSTVPYWDFVPGKHVPVLDGLRGLALAMVLGMHASSSVFPLGWIGVDLFFVLSGFLITGILLDAEPTWTSLKIFYVRRALRIFPLYYLALILFFIAGPYLAFPVRESAIDFTRQIRHEPWYWLYLQNWIYGFRGWPENESLTHFWSLAVEEQFYLIWPLMVMFGKRSIVLTSAIVAIPLAVFVRAFGTDLFGWQYPYFYTMTICRVDALMIGAVLAVGARYWPQGMRWVGPSLAIIGATVFLGILLLTNWDCRARNPSLYLTGFTMIDLMFGGLLITSMFPFRGNVLRALCLSSLFQWLGKMSYGIYVFHFPIHLFLYWNLRPELSAYLPEAIAKLASACVALVLALIVAKLSFEFWEQPFLSLKSRWATVPTETIVEYRSQEFARVERMAG